MGTEALDSLSHMSTGSPVDLDITLVFLIVLFVVLMVYLNRVLYQPYLRLRDIRYERIEGAKTATKEMQMRAGKTLATYEAKLTEARTGAAEERKRARHSAKTAEQEILRSARAEIDATVTNARDRLHADLERVEEQIERHARRLASEIVERVLSP